MTSLSYRILSSNKEEIEDKCFLSTITNIISKFVTKIFVSTLINLALTWRRFWGPQWTVPPHSPRKWPRGHHSPPTSVTVWPLSPQHPPHGALWHMALGWGSRIWLACPSGVGAELWKLRAAGWGVCQRRWRAEGMWPLTLSHVTAVERLGSFSFFYFSWPTGSLWIFYPLRWPLWPLAGPRSLWHHSGCCRTRPVWGQPRGQASGLAGSRHVAPDSWLSGSVPGEKHMSKISITTTCCGIILITDSTQTMMILIITISK